MEDLIQFLKTTPKNEYLGIIGFLGEELYSQKHKLTNLPFFHNKNIVVLEKPDYPKKTKFFILKEHHKHLLCDIIHIFAFYLIKDDKIIMNCSLDSFLDYEEENDKYNIT